MLGEHRRGTSKLLVAYDTRFLILKINGDYQKYYQK